MWWGKSQEKSASPAKESKEPSTGNKSSQEATSAAATQNAAAFDPDRLPERQKLPPKLQNIVDRSDKEDNFFDELIEGYAPESTESNVRYAAYAARFRTILLSAHRYVAYTSDVGESFRPIAYPWLVRGAYGISWAYILGDVSYEGYKAYWHNQHVQNPQLRLTERQLKVAGMVDSATEVSAEEVQPGVVPPLEDYRTVMVQRGLFQSIASMGLPAFTIHSVVRYSGQAMKGVKNKTLRTWGPIGLGLSVVPFLPRLFDKPVENAVEWVFHKGFETLGGTEAVGHSPSIGREKQLSVKPGKEKHL